MADSGRKTTLTRSESVPRNTRGTTVPLEKRADAIRAKDAGRPRPRRKPKPRRYDTTTSSRPRILEVAEAKAIELGYEALKLSDITTEAEISHQGFYIHFKNKRHAVAVATSDQLGRVAELVSRSSKVDEA